MEIKYYPEINETHYCSTLENGLNVVVIQKSGFKSSSCFIAFPYGSLDVKQMIGNQVQEYPSGIAHFL